MEGLLGRGGESLGGDPRLWSEIEEEQDWIGFGESAAQGWETGRWRLLGRRAQKSKRPPPTTTAQESPETLLHQLLPLHGDAPAAPARPEDLHAPGALPGAAAARPGALGLPHRELTRCLSGPRLLPALAALQVPQGGRLGQGLSPPGLCEELRRPRRPGLWSWKNGRGGWNRAEQPGI